MQKLKELQQNQDKEKKPAASTAPTAQRATTAAAAANWETATYLGGLDDTIGGDCVPEILGACCWSPRDCVLVVCKPVLDG